jgi:hypothetical protein
MGLGGVIIAVMEQMTLSVRIGRFDGCEGCCINDNFAGATDAWTREQESLINISDGLKYQSKGAYRSRFNKCLRRINSCSVNMERIAGQRVAMCMWARKEGLCQKETKD